MKVSVKTLLKFIIYFSIGFLAVKLSRSGYLKWPENIDLNYFIISLIFLGIAFWLQGLRWFAILRSNGMPITVRDSYVSNGLTLLSKYIPGKIWMIIGKALYIKERYGSDLKEISYISLQNQLLALWSGFFVGGVSLITFSMGMDYRWLSLIFFFLTLGLFTITRGDDVSMVAQKMFRKKVVIPTISIKQLFLLLPVFLLYWIFIAAGFGFLCLSLDIQVSVLDSFVFVLASVIGISAIIVPGGLGVREGVLVAYFSFIGINSADAISLSAFSRFWFLIIEIFTFITSFLLNRLWRS